MQAGSMITKMGKFTISPSILSADFCNFAKAISQIEVSGAPWLHMDVMDGLFVPNLTFGSTLVKAIRKQTKLFLDVHLMIMQPSRYLQRFADAGADAITIHYEAETHTHKFLAEIRQLGLKAGIAVVPSTPVSALEDVLPFIDLALIMTVDPGFGGQKLIGQCLEKIRKLAKMRKEARLDFKISVDGGINEETAPDVKKAGADVLVIGSAFFNSSDQKKLINNLCT